MRTRRHIMPPSLVASGHDYHGLTLAMCNFNGQDMTNANFNGATLTIVIFIKANLTGADFSGAAIVDGGNPVFKSYFLVIRSRSMPSILCVADPLSDHLFQLIRIQGLQQIRLRAGLHGDQCPITRVGSRDHNYRQCRLLFPNLM